MMALLLQQKVPSLGYLLGDEGSGSHLGRLLLSAGLRDELPKDLLRILKLDKELILDKLYESSSPNRFLASLVLFCFETEWFLKYRSIAGKFWFICRSVCECVW